MKINRPMIDPKRYDLVRENIFNILAEFKIEPSRMGTLFVEAWLTDEVANKIKEKYPDSIKLMVE